MFDLTNFDNDEGKVLVVLGSVELAGFPYDPSDRAAQRAAHAEARAFIRGWSMRAALSVTGYSNGAPVYAAPKVNEAGIPVFEKPAPACDRCGETGDIRAIRQPYGPADHVCADCFAQADAENSFTDLKEAI